MKSYWRAKNRDANDRLKARSQLPIRLNSTEHN